MLHLGDDQVNCAQCGQEAIVFRITKIGHICLECNPFTNPESHLRYIYNRSCNHCYHAFDEAGQLRSIGPADNLKAGDKENCESCGRYLIDGEISKLEVEF